MHDDDSLLYLPAGRKQLTVKTNVDNEKSSTVTLSINIIYENIINNFNNIKTTMVVFLRGYPKLAKKNFLV